MIVGFVKVGERKAHLRAYIKFQPPQYFGQNLYDKTAHKAVFHVIVTKIGAGKAALSYVHKCKCNYVYIPAVTPYDTPN